MKCTDCNGKGDYVGFASVEKCKRCGGTGQEPTASSPVSGDYRLTLCSNANNPYGRTPGWWYAFKVGEPATPYMAAKEVDLRYISARMLACDLQDKDNVRLVYEDEDKAEFRRLQKIVEDYTVSSGNPPPEVMWGPVLKLMVQGENEVQWHAHTKTARRACCPSPPGSMIFNHPGKEFRFGSQQLSTPKFSWWAPTIERLT